MTDKFLMFEEIYMNFKMVHENYNVFDLKKSWECESFSVNLIFKYN